MARSLTFRIEVDMGNSSFDDAPGTELARILRDVAQRAEAGEMPWPDDPTPVFDANGNRVGGWWIG